MSAKQLIDRYLVAYERYTGEVIPVSVQPDGRFKLSHKDGAVMATDSDIKGWTAYLEGRPAKEADKPEEGSAPGPAVAAPAAAGKGTQTVAPPGETRENIATLMLTKKKWKGSEIGDLLELSRTAVLFHLRALAAEGRCKKQGKGPAVTWSIVPPKAGAAPAAPSPVSKPPPPPEIEDKNQQDRDSIVAAALQR